MRSKRLPLLLGGASLLLSACAPDVYKDDIATFDESVVKSVDAFDALRLETDAGVIAGIENDLAKRGADVKPVGDCTDIVTGRLQKESSCMAKWASYRASGATAPDLEPLCREPARDEASGELEFYDLSEVTALEAQECRLGVVEDPKQPPRADLLTAPGVLRNTAELGTRLKA